MRYSLATRLVLPVGWLLTALSLVASLCVVQARAASLLDVPDIRLDASSFVLMEQSTGTLVKSRQPDARIQPASLTKLMTAYVLAESIKQGDIKLEQQTTISRNAWRIPGSTMFLEAGDVVSIEQLLLGLVVHSGNDAAVAIAELVSGGVARFVERMNQEAQRLGMTNTSYRNPNGLSEEGQYTTARDTATLTRALIAEHPAIYKRFYAEKSFTYRGITQHNRNRLLWLDEGFDGVKTGHIEAAGYHTVVSARRDDIRFIGVLLGAKSEKARTAQARKLMDWGFRHFHLYSFYQPFTELGRVRVWMGDTQEVAVGIVEPVVMVLARERSHRIDARLLLVQYQRAPIAAGRQMGELVISLGDEELRRVEIIALDEVAQGGFFSRIIDWCKLQLLKFNV